MQELTFRAAVPGRLAGQWRSSFRLALMELLASAEDLGEKAKEGVCIERRWGEGKAFCIGGEDSYGELHWAAVYHGWIDPSTNLPIDPMNPPERKTMLWLDDGRGPNSWEGARAEEKVNGPWVWVQTCAEASAALASGRYRGVSLDYVLDETDAGHTGLDLMRWILHEAEAGTLPRLEIYVHSHHPEAKEMRPLIAAAEQSWKAKEK